MRYVFFVVAASVCPLLSFFLTSDLPHTHDGLVHLPRIASYVKALSDGQIPVRWAGDLNYGYGMPLFIFIYPLPYILSSFFIFLGFGLVSSFKITLAASYILSGIFIFLFARAFFQDEKKALLVSIFYQFAPFRFVELLIRGSFGEVYTYTFLPLLLYALTSLFKERQFRFFILASLASALLILSHNAVSLLFFAVSLAFVIFFARDRRKLTMGILALFGGVLLSSFYWIPAILEHRYTYGDLFMKKLYLSHFPPLQNFFIPNVLNNRFLQTEGISVQFGIFHTVAAVFSLVLFVKDAPWHKDSPWMGGRRMTVFCFALLIVSLFFMQPGSNVFWERFSLLRQFQFPWRFLSVVPLATSLLSVHFFSAGYVKRKWIYWLCIFLVILSTVYYWRPSLGYDKVNESYYWNFPLNTTYYGETDVIWSAGPANSYPPQRVKVIEGLAKVNNVKKKSNLHTYTVDATTPSRVVDHTQYFPGWRVYVSGKQVPIEFQDQNWRGQITFPVARGKHTVQVVFGESPIRLIADIISLSTLIMLTMLFFWKSWKGSVLD